MADKTLVQLLKKSIKEWNEWCRRNLSEIDLSGADFTGMDLRRAILTGVDLNNALLDGANLSAANLMAAKLRGASLSKANLTLTRLIRADLCKANLIGADLTAANLSGGISLETHFAETRSGADLTGANLTAANLNAANLSGTNLADANFSRANLIKAIFNGANLNGADLNMATVGGTVFADVDLRQVKNIEQIRHVGRSAISIDTIYRSKGRIAFQFLRGAGIPENFIEYMQSLAGNAFEFYSCFISYSTRDQQFAERLHADLQDNGVRCWFAPHDAKAGQKLHEQIDLAIRLHEKLY